MKLLKTITYTLLTISITSCVGVKNGNVKATQENYHPIYIDSYDWWYRVKGDKNILRVETYKGKGAPFGKLELDKEYLVKPTDEQWLKLRNTMDELNVWQWKEFYDANRTDKTFSSLTLTYPDKKLVVKEMRSAYPKNYSVLIEALKEVTKLPKANKSAN